MRCLVPGSISRTLPRVSPSRKISPNPKSFDVAATFPTAHALCAANLALGIVPLRASCTMSATWFPVGRATSISFTRSIAALDATDFLTRTPPITPCPRPTTLTASSHSRSEWWLRTAYRTKPPAGTCGVTTAFSSLTRPSRTGWRPGGKKAVRQIDAEYLDWALAQFSGYIAIDEVYCRIQVESFARRLLIPGNSCHYQNQARNSRPGFGSTSNRLRSWHSGFLSVPGMFGSSAPFTKSLPQLRRYL